MKKKRVLILGASFSYIDSIKAAKEMGCEVIVTDRNPDAPGLALADIALNVDISDIEACVQAAKDYAIDGVVAVNDFGVPSAAHIGKELGLPGIPIEVAEIATSKYLMRKVWAEKDVPSVGFRKTESYAEFVQAVEEMQLPVIVKPCDSRGGGCRGIRQIDLNADLKEAYAFATGFYNDESLIVEEFVTGLEHSLEVIVYGGQCHIIAVSDKVKSPLPYRVDDTILYPTIEPAENMAAIQDAVDRAVAAIGMTEGLAHVELSMTERGPVLFELGARCGGGAPAPLVPYLTGVEEFKEAVRIALGERPQHLKPLYTKGCVIKFCYPEPGIVERISGVEAVAGLEGVLAFSLFVKVGDTVRPLRTCGDRAGMVITGAQTRDKALEIASFVTDTIKIETRPL